MNRSEIFTKAWKLYHDERRQGRMVSFGECLKRSWASSKAKARNAERIREAAKAAGITEEIRTWYGWKEAGREVIHESKNLFQVRLEKTSQPGKLYTASFFGISQTQAA